MVGGFFQGERMNDGARSGHPPWDPKNHQWLGLGLGFRGLGLREHDMETRFRACTVAAASLRK